MQGRNRVTRGRFLKMAGAGALSVLSASACRMSTTPASGGGGGPEEKALNLYNWSDYVSPSTIPGFEKKTGIEVTQDFFSSNEELLAKLQAGGTGYDVIVPSDYMVTIMVKSGVIRELDFSGIPNFGNLCEQFRNLPYDSQSKYSVPYQWGTTGILYNKKEVGEVSGWEAMWTPEFEGQIAMINDVRETLGAALMRLGYSLNSTAPDQLAEAEDLLKEQKPLVRGYFASSQNGPLVQNGDVALGHVYSGEGILAATEDENLEYVIPEQGATRWTDTMAIPVGAEHPENAHRFINHILDAKVGSALSNFTYYGTPNEAALPMIDKALRSIPTYFPPDSVFERLQVIQDVGKTTRDYERLFTEVKSA